MASLWLDVYHAMLDSLDVRIRRPLVHSPLVAGVGHRMVLAMVVRRRSVRAFPKWGTKAGLAVVMIRTDPMWSSDEALELVRRSAGPRGHHTSHQMQTFAGKLWR